MLELNTLIQTLGPAGLAFFIMWLWLKSVEKDKDKAQAALEASNNARLTELKEMLPLLSDTSKGLQEVLKLTTENTNIMVEDIVEHIDKKISELEIICKTKT